MTYVSRAVLSTIRRQRKGSSGVTPRFIVSYRDVARLVNYTRITTKESCDDYITIKCHVTYEVNELFITYCNNVLNSQGFAMHCRAILHRGSHFEVFEREVYFSVPQNTQTWRSSWRSKIREVFLLYLFE